MKFGVAAFRSCSRTTTLVHSEEHFMQPASQKISKSRFWTGRIISTILVLLLFDAIAKLLRLAPVLQAFDQLGWSRNLAIPPGIVLLTYMIPYTSALGALLLTAYLGGAVATHLRAAQAFYFPIVFGILLWVGLVLRNDRLRILLPMQD
jgi:hypothetical protein